jgi:hypothetical protein
MSRNLHQQFDALSSTEGIPMFYLTYVAYSSDSTQGVVDGKATVVYETTVNAVFKDEEARRMLGVFFKSHNILSATEIQFVLHFPAPLEFEGFARLNADATITKWASYDGPGS